jgi:hypothetical protein
MSVELHIIRASEFIRVGHHGRPNFQASKEMLTKLADTCRERGIYRVLLDLREVQLGPTPAFTPVELASIVETFHEIGFSHAQRLAVLYATDPHHGARLFAFISREQGWNVKAFDSYEKALDWLAVSTEPLREREAG